MNSVRSHLVTRIALPLLVALLACSDPAGFSRIRKPAWFVLGSRPAADSVPTTARVGEPVTVQVLSWFGGCVEPGETEAAVSGLLAEVHVYHYERVPPPNPPPNTFYGCPLDLHWRWNVATLTFATSGVANVRFIGAKDPGDAPYIIERQVAVSP